MLLSTDKMLSVLFIDILEILMGLAIKSYNSTSLKLFACLCAICPENSEIQYIWCVMKKEWRKPQGPTLMGT